MENTHIETPQAKRERLAKARETNALQKKESADREQLIKKLVLDNKSKGIAGLIEIMEEFQVKAFLIFDRLLSSDNDRTALDAFKLFKDMAYGLPTDVAKHVDDLNLAHQTLAWLQDTARMRSTTEIQTAVAEIIDDTPLLPAYSDAIPSKAAIKQESCNAQAEQDVVSSIDRSEQAFNAT